ncbi:MAG: M16 family metallopeptidase [Candidatus Hodarchaeota archaeon]
MKKIYIPKKGKTTVIMIVAKTGSRFEIDTHKGISHFIEHMCFKGTKKRTQKEINLGIEKYGGDINAFTGEEVTTYWAKISNEYKKEATDIIVDLASNPVFPIKEIVKERQVILQELKMYEDNPMYYIEELLNKNLYRKSSGLYLPIIGTKETLNNINRKELINYHNTNYRDLILILVGDVNKLDTYKDKKSKTDNAYSEVNTNNLNKKILVTKPDISQANVIIANDIRISNNKLDDMFALRLLRAVYNDMSGRLFTVIREKHNLVYYVRFYFNVHSCDSVKWEVDLGLEKNKINQAYDLIMEELTRPLTKKEIQYALDKELGSLDIYLDDNKNIARKVVDCVFQNVDYREMLYNYRKHLRNASRNINKYQEQINFKKNILVGLVPRGK